MILEAATDFFASNGFSGQTRDLAKQIGISQGLIFRYFGSKDALLEKVYQRVFLTRWSPYWTEHLVDRSQPIRARLKEFYRVYLIAVDDRRWTRIVMHSSLAGHDLARRWMKRVVEPLLGLIAEEINVEYAIPDDRKLDVETAWLMHSAIIYWLIRKHIHCTGTALTADQLADQVVDTFLDGVCSRGAAKSRGKTPRTSELTPRRKRQPASSLALRNPASTGVPHT